MAVGTNNVGRFNIKPTFGDNRASLFGSSNRSSVIHVHDLSDCVYFKDKQSFDTTVGYRGMVGRIISGEYNATNKV